MSAYNVVSVLCDVKSGDAAFVDLETVANSWNVGYF